jgi:hypothetical protein
MMAVMGLNGGKGGRRLWPRDGRVSRERIVGRRGTRAAARKTEIVLKPFSLGLVVRGDRPGGRSRMRDHLDTGTLLARESGDGRRDRRGVLFLVHRAADGWLAVDLTGDEIARFGPVDRASRCCGTCAELRCLRGGDAQTDRIFSLYAFDLDPESWGGLRVPAAGPLRFGFGGDLRGVVSAACSGVRPRLVLFRGLTALPGRSRSIPAGMVIARATPELVFETPAGPLWEEVRRLAGVARVARASFPEAAHEQIGHRSIS